MFPPPERRNTRRPELKMISVFLRWIIYKMFLFGLLWCRNLCLSHLSAQQCQPVSWWARCTARRPASQTCCTAWWRLRCPVRALRCPCGAGEPVECLNLCPQRFSYPGAAGGKSKHPPERFNNIRFSKAAAQTKNYPVMIALLHWQTSSKRRKKKENILPYLKKLFVRKRHNSFEYDYTGTIHIFLHKEEGKTKRLQSKSCFINSQFSF